MWHIAVLLYFLMIVLIEFFHFKIMEDLVPHYSIRDFFFGLYEWPVRLLASWNKEMFSLRACLGMLSWLGCGMTIVKILMPHNSYFMVAMILTGITFFWFLVAYRLMRGRARRYNRERARQEFFERLHSRS